MADWQHGFCDCFGDCGACVIGYCCPCALAWMASDAAGQDWFWGFLQCYFYPCLIPLMRYQVREENGIDGSLIEDLFLGWCCPCCAANQIYLEFD